MEDRALDTIDLENELNEAGEISEVAEVDEIDRILADPPPAVEAASRGDGRIELVLVGIANAFWAVAGLVLWIPQAVRAVLGAALRMIHAALTQQSSERAIAGILRVSRFYVERFLNRGSEAPMVARRHELRPLRLLFEAAWAAGFYLLILRWLSAATFDVVWGRLVALAGIAWGATRALAGSAVETVRIDLASLDFNHLQVAGILAVAATLGLGLGLWLGRRR